MSDNSKTDPSELRPEPEEYEKVAALGNALIAATALREYLEGLARGTAVDVAQTVWSGLSCRLEEMHQETMRELKTIRDLAASLTESRLDDHQRIVSLETWKERHLRGNDHCVSCPYHSEDSSVSAIGGE